MAARVHRGVMAVINEYFKAALRISLATLLSIIVCRSNNCSRRPHYSSNKKTTNAVCRSWTNASHSNPLHLLFKPTVQYFICRWVTPKMQSLTCNELSLLTTSTTWHISTCPLCSSTRATTHRLSIICVAA